MQTRYRWMIRLGCVLVSLIGSPILAQDQPAIELTISPKAASVPVMKHHLWPMGKEVQLGDAGLIYARIRSPEEFRDPEKFSQLHTWAKQPIPADQMDAVKAYMDRYRVHFPELDRAARMHHCIWDRERRADFDSTKADPVLQVFRDWIVLIQMRARLAIAEGKLDEAQVSLITGMGIAKHIGEGMTVMHQLAGLAMSLQMLNIAEEWITQPSSPNLYWALTELPTPLLDLKRCFANEMRTMNSIGGNLDDLRTQQMTVEAANARLAEVLDSTTLNGGLLRSPMVRTLLVALQHSAAKRTLIKNGQTVQQVDRLPDAQVVLLAAMIDYQAAREDVYKWLMLPYPEARTGIETAEKLIHQSLDQHPERISFYLAKSDVPVAQVINRLQGRVERKVAILRTIEAIRMHAAGNGNALPKSLADITLVPIPNDPMTGKPFEYTLKAGQVDLFAPTPMGEQGHMFNSVRYVLTVRK